MLINSKYGSHLEREEKMVLFLKSISRTVHHYQEETEKQKKLQECTTSLTVWRKSLLFSCSGFTVISSDGRLAYRVDNYVGRPNRVVLMDGSGDPIFTICRPKKLSFLDKNWLVYEGEVSKETTKSCKKPVFCVRKNTSMSKKKLAHVYCDDKRCMYVIEGSYRHRSCRILDDSRRLVGEIKRKEAMAGGASFGIEVFHLMVNPVFQSGFAMAFVLLLDQMFT